MATLNKALRNQLEKVVAQARTIAVAGAERALNDELEVGAARPRDMSDELARLRTDLRAHGRQLGDKRDTRSGEQETKRLVQACAYEHWNRMLFARFLAENNLLLDAEHGLSLAIEDVQELAREQQRDWMELASELAQRMLLSVFDPNDPVLRVKLPVETRLQLDKKLECLPSEAFLADDSLGWVYQFWQKDEKEKVNRSEVKIGGDDLPAVTQLFTEDYMVLFLLENTLGAWWTAKRSDSKLLGYEWTYLRLNEDGTPAAGAFDGWPRTAREIAVLDPCMGSGHFLTFALPILARMRQVEEELSLKDAIGAVLKDNLFGLELDARCSQIAAFNLALTAWRLARGHFDLPVLNLACSGIGINADECDWVALAGEDGRDREEMRRLYSLFKDAPTLGSLIDPLRLQENVFAAGADRVRPLLGLALTREQDGDRKELLIAAKGLLTAFRQLAEKYTLVCTNVPYLGSGKQSSTLAGYCSEFHTDAKADLSTTFVDRCLRFCCLGGSAALVTPQNWLFLTTYSDLRLRLIEQVTWDAVAKLGPAAFQEMNWWAATTSLVVLTRTAPPLAHATLGLDASRTRDPLLKGNLLRNDSVSFMPQAAQKLHPDSRILLSPLERTPLLEEYADSFQGVSPADLPRFGRRFWEVCITSEWRMWQSTVEETVPYGGRDLVLWWSEGLHSAVRAGAAFIRGDGAWGKMGIAVRQMRHLPCTLYTGELFDTNCAAVVPKDPGHLPAIWTFCSSETYARAVRQLDQKTNVTNSTLVKVPFDLDYWQRAAAERYPSGLPKPSSPDPTQWIFSGDPQISTSPLQVAIARMLGYKWPRQSGCAFPGCSALETDGRDSFSTSEGISCLVPLAGDISADERLRSLLENEYKGRWSSNLLTELIGTAESLTKWLPERFFYEHCELFDHVPFIWHIWDGQLDGFHAFVNYHKLAAPNGEGRKTLERLTYTLLNDWIERQRSEVQRKVDGAETRLAGASHLQSELKKILEGEPPYDIFIRWKPLDQQPIGWEPDINDGVRINIRPFLNAKPYRGSRNSCILRITPKIKHGKDRGKEPWRPKEEYPWFWGWDERTQDFTGGDTFDGARWNDLHYSNEMKRKSWAKKAEADASKS